MKYSACRSVIFFIPVHNEELIIERNILKLLQHCQAQDFRFAWKIEIVVNGSGDRTREIADELSQRHPGLILVREFPEAGRGWALKRAWDENQADLILYMDIDLSVSLTNLDDLLRPLLNDECDLAVGSRLLADSRIRRSFRRELVSQSYNFLSRLILHHHFSDLQCGFKAMKREAFISLSPHLRDQGWFFDTELIIWAYRFGYRVKDIPVDWSENRFEARKSKVRLFRDSCRFLINLFRLKFRIARTVFPRDLGAVH